MLIPGNWTSSVWSERSTIWPTFLNTGNRSGITRGQSVNRLLKFSKIYFIWKSRQDLWQFRTKCNRWCAVGSGTMMTCTETFSTRLCCTWRTNGLTLPQFETRWGRPSRSRREKVCNGDLLELFNYVHFLHFSLFNSLDDNTIPWYLIEQNYLSALD